MKKNMAHLKCKTKSAQIENTLFVILGKNDEVIL